MRGLLASDALRALRRAAPPAVVGAPPRAAGPAAAGAPARAALAVLVVCVGLAAPATGCGDHVRIALRLPDDALDDPLSAIDALVLSAEVGAGGETIASRRFSATAARLTLDPVPYREDLSLVLTGVNELPGGDSVRSIGRTCPADFAHGAVPADPLPMYFAAARRFAAVAAPPAGTPPALLEGQGGLAIVLDHARVLLGGGAVPGAEPLADALEYDHASGALAARTVTGLARAGAALAPLRGGWLVAGGAAGTGALDDAVFVRADGAVTARERTLGTPRTYFTLTALPDGRLLVAGGHDGATPLASAEVCDPAADPNQCLPGPGEFVPVGSLATPRWGHTATAVLPNAVFVIGGCAGDLAPRCPAGAAVATIEVYSPVDETFSPSGTAVLADNRAGHTATVLDDFSILVAGGVGLDGFPLDSAELFDPTSRDIAATAEPMLTAREGHTATRLPDGRVLVAGGRGRDGEPLASAEIYDPADRTFVVTADLRAARAGHVAVVLCDGTVLLAGGAAAPPYAEIYTPQP
ncbi:MAG TPA: kelch repeat-containing protein [Myxococcota bacterium]|jgi:hypothetical protein|nr:kelch repeat-containing protein [Myxococcota bacterium]